eukprot:scaffold1207_cov371-Pavlova_lutheri.AAC.10
MEAYATQMSHNRESVEWVIGEMGELWPFVTDVRRKTTGSHATSKEDCVAALLTNYHTCRYGGVAIRYFDTLPPSMKHAMTRHLEQQQQQQRWMDGLAGAAAAAAAMARVDGLCCRGNASVEEYNRDHKPRSRTVNEAIVIE